MFVGWTLSCSGCGELSDLLAVGLWVAMEPLLEQRLHRAGGQVAAADEPLIALLEAEHPDQPGERAVVGEDADDVGAAAISLLKRSSGFVLLSFDQRAGEKA